MQSPLISVIIPCYNQGRFLSETLDSVLAQTYENWEAIIVNDGSTDNTQEIANRYCAKDQRFKYIYKSNAGLSAARNTGIINSNGIYILPLDSDDKIGSRYMELAIEAFTTNDELKVVYCRATMFGRKKGEWRLPPYSIERMMGRNCIFCSAFYRRVDFDNIGGYNTNMKYGFEDWDFWLSMFENGGQAYQINEILFYYRIRKRSMVRMLDQKKMMHLRYQIWQNHRDLYDKNFLNPLETFEYLSIAESKEYILGKLILNPIRRIFSIF
ncbi:MAG: putative glycosyltransferase EpsJ [Bacteroides rodentium]